MNKVIVTGSTGFIGSHIAEKFYKQGVPALCLARKKSNLSNLAEIPAKIVYGDITDYQSLVKAFHGCRFVIHTAGYVSDWGRYELFYQSNVVGTMNVLKACVQCNIKNVILTGSTAVYQPFSLKHQPINEAFPQKPHIHYFSEKLFPSKLNYYRDTKSLAKEQAVRFASQNGLNLTILEPVWVFGEREFHSGFYDYLKAAKNSFFFPGTPANKFHVVYVKDLANAYYLAYKKKLNGIHSLIIGNRKAEFMDKIYGLFCKEAGIKKPSHLPREVVYPVGLFLELVHSLFHVQSSPLLTRSRVNMFYDNLEYDISQARELLGFRDSYTLEKAVTQTVNWYQEHHYL